MRYTVDTRLRPGEVYARAKEAFGSEGAGLAITEHGLNRMVFAGDGGYVIIAAHRAGFRTRVSLEVYRFDTEAERFINALPGPSGWLRRFWGSWRRDRRPRRDAR